MWAMFALYVTLTAAGILLIVLEYQYYKSLAKVQSKKDDGQGAKNVLLNISSTVRHDYEIQNNTLPKEIIEAAFSNIALENLNVNDKSALPSFSDKYDQSEQIFNKKELKSEREIKYLNVEVIRDQSGSGDIPNEYVIAQDDGMIELLMKAMVALDLTTKLSNEVQDKIINSTGWLRYKNSLGQLSIGSYCAGYDKNNVLRFVTCNHCINKFYNESFGPDIIYSDMDIGWQNKIQQTKIYEDELLFFQDEHYNCGTISASFYIKESLTIIGFPNTNL